MQLYVQLYVLFCEIYIVLISFFRLFLWEKELTGWPQPDWLICYCTFLPLILPFSQICSVTLNTAIYTCFILGDLQSSARGSIVKNSELEGDYHLTEGDQQFFGGAPAIFVTATQSNWGNFPEWCCSIDYWPITWKRWICEITFTRVRYADLCCIRWLPISLFYLYTINSTQVNIYLM